MAIKIALILSIVLQFAAAIIALSLTKRTKTNIAWWLISIGFLFMAFRRVFELFQVYDVANRLTSLLLSSWIGVLISVIMLLSLMFIKRIFNIQKQLDDLRKTNEARVLSAIIKTEETERQNFAKELHDGLGPLLSSVKMAISSVNTFESTKREVLVNAEKLIDESIQSLKEVSNKLSPHILNNFGLRKAMKSFIVKLQILKSPLIHFNSNIENQRFSYNIEVVLYRVMCELIANTLKHAHANNIYMDLLVDQQSIHLKYIDDGIGFDAEKNNLIQKGFGFSNISSRITSLNGNFDVYSKIGEGVQVQVLINLEGYAKN
ncbi:MAG: sensor histidine kinase [Prolixibacteraceae bacterium]